METTHKVFGDWTVRVEFVGNKYRLLGLFFQNELVLQRWEDIATFVVVVTDYCQGRLRKETLYSIGNVTLYRLQKQKIQYLLMDMLLPFEEPIKLELQQIEARIIPAVLNRVLARCDLLSQPSIHEYKPFKITDLMAEDDIDWGALDYE